MAAVGEKRVLEEAETALAVEEQPDAKIAKVEGSEEPATVSGSEAAEDAAAAPVADDSEVTIGYKTMSGAQTQAYFQDLLSNLRRYQSLNEYEHHMVCELVKLGHPDAERKVRRTRVEESRYCIMVFLSWYLTASLPHFCAACWRREGGAGSRYGARGRHLQMFFPYSRGWQS